MLRTTALKASIKKAHRQLLRRRQHEQLPCRESMSQKKVR
jgi:hypothetical protein